MLKRGCWLALVFLATLWLSAPWATSQPDGAIPAYHASPPPKAGKLPPILTRDQLWGEDAQNPYQTHAYELAAKIPAVIYQQPCYCYCDRMGHKSLHSCFENTHGARCDICLKELYYSYAEHQKGKTAAEIRKAIIAGDWRAVDLASAWAAN
ncbi:MAG TPA: CYCXC family (seleno)protein [Terriglobales bacterium]|nr:CYCXC family (seleno)protein [Terriglobales bacterium]